ncbi:GDP-mannose 4,6-dehydratase [Janthinobacterium sp. PAMC25594]|nr:GDP-mannose 4,6-dehydratase [Janthinobacterium sp. PAMC25594]
MATRALITGIQGFTGRYMAAELVQAGYEVFGLAHGSQGDMLPGVKDIVVCDLDDQAALSAALEFIQPDVVIHLAAIAFVAHGDANAIYRTNLIGTRNLLEALSKAAKKVGVVLLASSANVYGNSTGGTLDEASVTAPANDYAVSKLAMEYLAKTYLNRLPIIIARPFNYTGVHQSESFLLPKIVSHIRTRRSVIELGNINVSRDFSDVRIVVQYYRRLLECSDAIGETFNVCSEVAYSLQDVLIMAQEISGHILDIRINPQFVRANEVPILIGSRTKLVETVGEVTSIELSETLRWMINYSE